MPDPTDTPPSTEPPSPSSGDPKASRRRLLQGALASAPVLMTLVSRPVLAAQCQTPSGFVSANASHPGAAICSGNGPVYWSGHQDAWPGTGNDKFKPQDKFSKHFNPDLSGNPTLIQVLDPSFPNAVARYVVAALLNTGPPLLTPVLSANAVKGIWTEFGTGGSFSPSSGVHWTADEIVAYLRPTMTTS